jgi:hypothetical protein
LPSDVAAGPYRHRMTLLARMLGFGLDAIQASPRRGRTGAVLAVAMLLTFSLWPELPLEVARLRVEPILEAITESVQDVGSRTQGQ